MNLLCRRCCALAATLLLVLSACEPLQTERNLSKVIELENSGEFTKALAKVTEMQRIKPSDPHLLRHAGYCQQMTGDYKSSAKSYREVLRQVPGDSYATFQLGYVCLELQQWEEAIKLYEQLLKSDPAHEPVLSQMNYGYALESVGRNEEADAAYRASLKGPRNRHITKLYINAASNCEKMGRLGDARVWCDLGLKLFPEDPWLWEHLGWICESQNDSRSAEEAYAKAHHFIQKQPYPALRSQFSLPFRGAWKVVQGNGGKFSHRGITSFYAWDFQLEVGERTYVRNGTECTDYYAYGQEVLAPADGRVVELIDGHPDNKPGWNIKRNTPGNRIRLEHFPGEYSEFLHLKAGSFRVKKGDQVKRGQVLAQCGNSGFSGMPHLHFSFVAGKDGASRPSTFVNYRVKRKGQDITIEQGAPKEGEVVQRVE